MGLIRTATALALEDAAAEAGAEVWVSKTASGAVYTVSRDDELIANLMLNEECDYDHAARYITDLVGQL